MEARKDTDVNVKVNQRGLVPVSSLRRAERWGASTRSLSRGIWERAQGSAAELSHSGCVSTGCGMLRAGSEGGEGGRFTSCSSGRQHAPVPAGLRVWRHADRDGSPRKPGKERSTWVWMRFGSTWVGKALERRFSYAGCCRVEEGRGV